MPRRVSPMAGPLTRAWRGLADEALAAKTGAAHGERGTRIVGAAQRAQASPILIRRAITARLALLRLETGGVVVPELVWSLPVGVAEAIARWAGRDPETAWRWAADYDADSVTFSALVEAERASRGGSAGRTTKSGPNHADDPIAWRAAQLVRYTKASGRRVLPPTADDLPVAGWAYEATSETPTGLLVIGPHADPSSYLHERPKVCVMAVGIAKLAGRALLISPFADVSGRYASWLAERSIFPEVVGVATIEPATRSRRSKPQS